jgi:hypothetical protein
MAEDNFTVRYSNKDIMDRLEEIRNELTRLTEHVTTQNGRVGRLEKFRGSIMVALGTSFIALVGWLIMISLRL